MENIPNYREWLLSEKRKYQTKVNEMDTALAQLDMYESQFISNETIQVESNSINPEKNMNWYEKILYVVKRNNRVMTTKEIGDVIAKLGFGEIKEVSKKASELAADNKLYCESDNRSKKQGYLYGLPEWVENGKILPEHQHISYVRTVGGL